MDVAEGTVMCLIYCGYGCTVMRLILWMWLYSNVPYIVDMAEGTVMCLILWIWLKVQ